MRVLTDMAELYKLVAVGSHRQSVHYLMKEKAAEAVVPAAIAEIADQIVAALEEFDTENGDVDKLVNFLAVASERMARAAGLKKNLLWASFFRGGDLNGHVNYTN